MIYSLPFSQLIPEYPVKHLHKYPLLKLLHLPCFPHGIVKQWFVGGAAIISLYLNQCSS